MTVILASGCGLLGALVGSFLNVVIWRVPRGESVVHPASTCPTCGHRIRRSDLVPVLSWFLLGGRCRACRTPITARYPLVELLTAAVLATVSLRLGLVPELPAFLYLGAISVALTLIDLDVKRLPDAIVLPSYPVGLVLLGAAAASTGQWGSLLRAVLGMTALFTVYLTLALISPAGMGLGDVKLAGVLGLYLAWLGWSELLVGGFLAFLLGGVVGGGLMLAGRAGRKSAIPFGPFMLTAALIAVLAGDVIAASYLATTGL